MTGGNVGLLSATGWRSDSKILGVREQVRYAARRMRHLGELGLLRGGGTACIHDLPIQQ